MNDAASGDRTRDDDLAHLSPELRARFAAERDRFEAALNESRRRYKLDSLTGMAVNEAQAIVEAEGGYFEPLPADDPDVAVTADIRSDRVRAWVRDGRVESADVG